MLAEVVVGEVRERAEADADPRHPRRARRARLGLDLPHQVVHQRLLVHAATSSRIASRDLRAAAADFGAELSPVSKLAPSIP